MQLGLGINAQRTSPTTYIRAIPLSGQHSAQGSINHDSCVIVDVLWRLQARQITEVFSPVTVGSLPEHVVAAGNHALDMGAPMEDPGVHVLGFDLTHETI